MYDDATRRDLSYSSQADLTTARWVPAAQIMSLGSRQPKFSDFFVNKTKYNEIPPVYERRGAVEVAAVNVSKEPRPTPHVGRLSQQQIVECRVGEQEGISKVIRRDRGFRGTVFYVFFII